MSELIKINTALNKSNASLKVANKLLMRFDDDLPELIPYRKGNKWGFCDRNRKIIIDCKYTEVKLFKGGLAAVNMGGNDWSEIGKWGFINENGELVIEHNYGRVSSFEQGCARVKYREKWGIIDQEGRVLVGFKYDYIDAFFEGLAVVDIQQKVGHREVSRIGYLNTSFEEAIPCVYERFWHYENCRFRNGLALVKRDFSDKPFEYSIFNYGIINSNGIAVVPLKYNWLGKLSEGLSAAQLSHWSNSGFVNCRGDEVTQMEYDCVFSFSDGLAQVHKNGKYGYIDLNGNIVIPIEIEPVFTSSYDGHESEDNLSFSFGFAPFRNNDKFGFINKSGDIAIPCIYDFVFSFHDGLAMIVQNNKVGFIDTNGSIVIQPEYDYDWHDYFDSNGCRRTDNLFNNGMAKVKKNRQWGVINKTGGQIIPCKYHQMHDFKNGLAWVTLNYKHKGGYIGINGVEYWED